MKPLNQRMCIPINIDGVKPVSTHTKYYAWRV